MTVTSGGVLTGVNAGTASVGAGDPSEPVFAAVCGFNSNPCPIAFGVSRSASGNVGDPTPVVQNISPPVWNAGATTVGVTITGTGFGTAPQLTLDDTSIGVLVTSRGDTQIVANVTVGASAPNENVTVTVTSTGYNGSGFQSGGGSQSSHGSKSAKVQAQAVLVNFHLTGATDVGNGELDVTYVWGSSTGNLNDLSACTTGEFVQYPTPPGVDYQPATPPFPVGTYPNPTIIQGPATAGGAVDKHRLPMGQTKTSFVKPYSASSFSATQYYWYECNNSAFVHLKDNLVITRSVSANGVGGWKFTVTSNDTPTSATINPLP